MTLTARILEFVASHPKCTAWGIAKNLKEDSATVSSILALKVRKGILKREKNLADTWVYFN